MHRGSQKKRPFRFLEDSSFVRYYLWKYKRWVGIGLLALVVVDILDVCPPILLKHAVDIAVEHRPAVLLAWAALAYLGISLLQGLCRYGWRMYLIRASVFAGRDLRNQYSHHLFGLSVSFFERRRLGDLMSLATNDVEAVRIAIGSGVLVFADALFFLVTVPVAMFLLSPKLTLLCCLPLPLIPWIVMRNENDVHQRFLKVQECFGKISAMTQESLNGIRVTKAFAKENSQIRRMKELGAEYTSLNLALARVQSRIGPSLDFTMSLGLILLLFFGGGAMIRDPKAAITLGTFVAFQRYIQKMVWPMAALGMAVNYFQRAFSSSNRLKEIFAISTDVPSTPKPQRPPKVEGRVEFKDLSFMFPGSNQTVLNNIHLTIDPGERIAIVGMIGAGKTALLSLVPRLYPISRGMLFIDGIDVNDWPIHDLRKSVGYVSQDIFLFSESVFENVALGLHEWVGKLSPTHSIEEATQTAAMHDEISSFSLAYETQLGERGVNLSGGQKQRLTLARALAKRPPILVLDDALSSVDINTEEKILRALRSREGRNTELIAAHRISTVRDADRIIVLEKGKIVQDGSHNQLIKAYSGIYSKFVEQQKLKEDVEHYEGP